MDSDEPAEEMIEEVDILDYIDEGMYFGREAYLGMYAGLFGISGKAVVPKPTEKCFGPWITDEMRGIRRYIIALETNFWGIEFEDTRQVAYSGIDLIFENDEYCHFRKVGFCIYDYCSAEGNCDIGTVIDNITENAFALITSVSQVFSIFKQTAWTDMDKEEKGYAFNQIGHATTTLFADLWGFKPTAENMEEFAEFLQ